jgi:hypothetical protein
VDLVEAVVVSIVAIATLCWLAVMVALVIGEGIGRPLRGHPLTWFAIVALVPGLGLVLFLTFGANLQRADSYRLIAAALVGISAAVLIALIMSPDPMCRVEQRAGLQIETCTVPGGVSATTLMWVSAATAAIAWAILGRRGGGPRSARGRPLDPKAPVTP